MSDLDKLMKKLKTDEPTPVEPTPVAPVVAQAPAPIVAPTPSPAPAQAPAIDDDDDEDEDELPTTNIGELPTPAPIVAPTPTPVESEVIAEGGAVDPTPETEHDPNPEHEVALLQNDGIFRREMLMTKKEQVDVLKVIAQTLLDIKKKLMGEDGKN